MKEKILKLRKQGLTYNEIKNKLGCAKSTISYHCKKENIGNDLSNLIKEWNISDIELKNISKLHSKGLTDSDIHKKLKINNNNITKQKINLICKKYRNGEPPNKGIKINRFSDEFIKIVQKYYDEGNSLRNISKKFKVARSTIREYLTLRILSTISIEERRKRKSKNVIEWRKRVKIKLVEYKGGECEKCGYNKCMRSLEFHHQDPNEKDFTVGGKSWSFERLRKEVDKCILICRNCHGEIHEEMN